MLDLNRIYCGDCLDLMREMPDKSVDSVVTDPPYGLSFMDKEWDHGVPGVPFWQECLRVCKPGAHVLAFGGTRTHHRLMVAIEDAGWEIRDTLMWVYGSGFPKSHDISKSIDKIYGVERDVIGINPNHRPNSPKNITKGDFNPNSEGNKTITAPKSTDAIKWNGWGTALKPAWEPIILCRKPLDGTVANNVQTWGVGGINIDGCRVETQKDDKWYNSNYPHKTKGYDATGYKIDYQRESMSNQKGRFPANLIHDGSDEVVGLFPQSNGGAFPVKSNVPTGKGYDGGWGCVDNGVRTEMGSGSAARFFYCAKASKSERGEGNTHPTVKPLALMRYLCRLITPSNGVVLDPFCGSGSTGVAALQEMFNFIGMDKDPISFEIAEKRLEKVNNHKITDFFGVAP